MEKLKFHVLIKYCFLMEKILFKQSNGLISVVPTLLHQKQWYVDFKHGHTDTNDAERSVCPNSAVVSGNTKILHKLILADHKLKLHEIGEDLKISEGLHDHFVNEKAVFKVGVAFTHSRLKTTMRQRFRVLFATVSTQHKGVFV